MVQEGILNCIGDWPYRKQDPKKYHATVLIAPLCSTVRCSSSQWSSSWRQLIVQFKCLLKHADLRTLSELTFDVKMERAYIHHRMVLRLVSFGTKSKLKDATYRGSKPAGRQAAIPSFNLQDAGPCRSGQIPSVIGVEIKDSPSTGGLRFAEAGMVDVGAHTRGDAARRWEKSRRWEKRAVGSR